MKSLYIFIDYFLYYILIIKKFYFIYTFHKLLMSLTFQKFIMLIRNASTRWWNKRSTWNFERRRALWINLINSFEYVTVSQEDTEVDYYTWI